MLRITLVSAWSHKRRMVGTVLAIVLGVAFLSATLVLGESARAGFASVFGEANAGTDAIVRSNQKFTAAEEAIRPPIAASVVDQISAVDGVARAVAIVEGVGQVLDAEGTPIGGDGPPTTAAAWIDDPTLTGWDLVEGRAPMTAGEVVVDRATAAEAGATVGSSLAVLVPRPVTVTVVGLAAFGDEDSLGGLTYVAFTLAEAQRLLLGNEDLVSGVVVAATDGVGADALVARINDAVPDGVAAITGDALTAEQQADIEGDFLGFFTTALVAFAMIALLVAAFSIFNTFSILTAQRTQESALLRTLGASRRQVLASALFESVVVGVVGATIGTGTGVVLATGMLRLMDSAGFGLPIDGLRISLGAMTLAVAAGLGVTLIAGLLPARRASRVAPLAALRDVSVDTADRSRWRAVAGWLLTAAGALTLLAGADLALTGVGAVGLIVGVVIVGPVVARPVSRILGAPLVLRGVSGDLARRNAARNPRRTAASATALLVGVGVVSLFTVLGASVSKSIENQIDRSFGGDLALTPAGGEFSGTGLSPDLVSDLAALPAVQAATGLGFGAATIDGRQQVVGFSDPSALAQVTDSGLGQGNLADVDDAALAMSARYADDHGYRMGEKVEVGFADGSTESLSLVATYDQLIIGGDVLVTADRWSAHNHQPSYNLALVKLAEGVSLEAGRDAVESTAGLHGSPAVEDRDQFVESQASEMDVLLNVIYGLLAVAMVIALMGIANTLSLSVHERTRELGLLRALGQGRPQLRAMVRWESVIVAVFGSVGGVGVGLFLSWGLVRALPPPGGFVGTYAVPVGSLVTVLAVGSAVGVIAGLRPAWRASRLDVLAAVAS